jgi:hypothetical protein
MKETPLTGSSMARRTPVVLVLRGLLAPMVTYKLPSPLQRSRQKATTYRED